MFPASCPTEEIVALDTELPFLTSLTRGDAHRLRMGDVSPVRSMAQTPSDEDLVISTSSIPAAVQIAELIREQTTDP
jgi:hypothetical protein